MTAFPRLSPARSAFVTGAAFILALLGATTARAATQPLLPQVVLDTTPVVVTGVTIPVVAGGDFQAALNAAQPGDQITLQAGASYQGPFTLPVKAGAGWITVRTSAPDSSLPPYGTRITPAYAAVLPKLLSANSSPALLTAPGAHHYRFVGVEITVGATVSMSYGLVNLGDGSVAQNVASRVPYALTFDRVYVHGNATVNLQRGIAINSASTAIVNSYIADIHYAGIDSQAVAGWSGPGPFKIVNNYLEASSENLLFGGADPAIANLVPSDIEIRGNYFNKPTTWMQSAWTVKNLFELKNARRVLVDGNIFEHNWPQAQNGYAILFTVRNQDGTAPWSTVSDVTFTHNVVRHVASGVNVLGQDNIYVSQQEQNILIQDNLFDDVSAVNWGGSGRLIQVLNGAANVTVDHNTAFQSSDFLLASLLPQVGFTFTNNLVPNNLYGLGGDACYGSPMLCIATFLPGARIAGNAIVGGTPALYPLGNVFPPTLAAVGFADVAGGIYQLGPSSPYRNAGTDGKDLGADWAGLTTAVAGVFSGVFAAPPATDTTPPAVSLLAPLSGAVVSGSVTISAGASDASGITQVVIGLDGTNASVLTASPYQLAWDTTKSTNGTHTISAVATDLAGNQGTAVPITVTVSNVAPAAPLAVTSVGASAITASGASIAWITSAAADSQVQYGTTTAYSSTTTLNPALVVAHSEALAGLSASTLYHYRVLSRDGNGTLSVSADATLTTTGAAVSAAAPVPAPAPVTWTALVNATAAGGGLQKTGGCNGCADAGGVSTQTLASGDGYVEFTTSELTTARALGLSKGNPGTTVNEIAFGLLLWPGGEIDVRESGVYRTESKAATGDRFRIAVTAGKVTYAKNGAVFYTSTVAPAYPLLVDTAFLTTGGTFGNVVMSSAGSAGLAAASGGSAAPAPVTWTALVNAVAAGGGLQKTGGCNGCADAGGVSTQTLASGDGYVEFTASELTTTRALGLSKGNPGTTVNEIAFGLLLWAGGEIDVREGGVYRSESTAATGDRFRIAVTAGKVTYAKNGAVFYTSTVAPTYPLLVDTAFLTAGGTLSNVVTSVGP